jgi:four helix bundle protein
VVSITSNIAEGFSRQSYQEKVRFYSISLGSTTELQNQLIISKDVDLLDSANFENLFQQSIKVHKIVNGLIRGSKAIVRNS